MCIRDSIGTAYGLAWVAVGVTCAIVLNYVLMADLSLRTAPIGWGHFLLRQTRGLWLGLVTLAACLPATLLLRAADAGNLLTLLGGSAASVLALVIAWRVAPEWTLGDDGAWIVEVIKSKGGPDDTPAPISLEVTA